MSKLAPRIRPNVRYAYIYVNADGGARDIIIYFKVEAAVFKITRVLLVEHTADHKQTHALPVVAEPRDVKWPSVLLGFLVAFAIGAGSEPRRRDRNGQ